MKKICVILPTKLPIPTVLGGAVEDLVEKIINENEVKYQYDFTIITIFNQKAHELSKKYQHTKFLNFYLNMKSYKIKSLLCRICRRLLKNKWYSLETRAAEKIIKNNRNFDYVIVDGGDPNMIFLVNKYYPKSKILFHIHGSIRPTRKLDEAFNYLITVSNYIADVWKETSARSNAKIKVLKNCTDVKKFSKIITESEKNELIKTLEFTKNDFIIMFT